MKCMIQRKMKVNTFHLSLRTNPVDNLYFFIQKGLSTTFLTVVVFLFARKAT